ARRGRPSATLRRPRARRPCRSTGAWRPTPSSWSRIRWGSQPSVSPGSTARTSRKRASTLVGRSHLSTSWGNALALGELRRLARLVQAGLLALDLTGVASQEALAL